MQHQNSLVAPTRTPAFPTTELPPFAGAGPGVATDLGSYIDAIARHRALVAAFTLFGAVVGILLMQRVEPSYVSRAVLWAEATAPVAVEGRVAEAEALLDASGWRDLVTSNAVLDSVVRVQRLYIDTRDAQSATALRHFEIARAVTGGDYELEVGADSRYTLRHDAAVVETGRLGDSVGTRLGFRWVPTAEELSRGDIVGFRVRTPWDAADALARKLRVEVEPRATFIRLELRGTSASTTAATLNAVAERTVFVAGILQRQRLEALDAILSEQYDHAEGELLAAEQALASYRVRAADRPAVALAADGQTEAYLRLDDAVDSTRRSLRRLEAVLAAARAGESPLDALAAVADDAPRLQLALDEATRREAEIRALRARYSDESAPVVAARAAQETLLRTSIPALAEAFATELRAREASLVARRDAYRDGMRAAPPQAVALARLERDVTNAAALFATVRERRERNRLALLSSVPTMHVLDRAQEPQLPTSDLRPLVLALSVVSSFGLVAFGVRAKEQMDSRIRRPEQVVQSMGLRILGSVPRVSWRRVREQATARQEVIEALRGLRVRLLQARGSSPLSLTVTSPATGEGKSFIAVNLALSFAQGGYRTVLVDGDVRRGVQHRVLGVEHLPGLAEVLSGETTAGAAVRETSFPGLALLGSGRRDMRTPELLTGPRVAELVAELGAAFDVVIVDSAPLSAGVDALMLARATTNLLMVLRAGSTDLPSALVKLEAMSALPINVVGAVLNDVREREEFRAYGYDLTGYTVDDPSLRAVAEAQSRVLGGRP